MILLPQGTTRTEPATAKIERSQSSEPVLTWYLGDDQRRTCCKTKYEHSTQATRMQRSPDSTNAQSRETLTAVITSSANFKSAESVITFDSELQPGEVMTARLHYATIYMETKLIHFLSELLLFHKDTPSEYCSPKVS